MALVPTGEQPGRTFRGLPSKYLGGPPRAIRQSIGRGYIRTLNGRLRSPIGTKLSPTAAYRTTTFTSLSGTVITLTTCLPSRKARALSSAIAPASRSCVGVPKGT
jgi:hypothetical protein